MAIALSIVAPGTIGDYSDLSALIARYMDRDDLGVDLAKFIVLVEAECNRVLRAVNQETKTLWVISDETFQLPSDFRKLRKIHIEGEPDRPLVEMSPVAAPMIYTGEKGLPRAYWLEGRVMTLAPPPLQTTTFRVTYFTRIEPLTPDTPVNWLLEEHPDVYVWGVLRQAAIYIRDPEAVATTDSLFNTAIEQLKLESRTDRFGGGPLVPTGVQQVSRYAKC